jgi:hypothetical protein
MYPFTVLEEQQQQQQQQITLQRCFAILNFPLSPPSSSTAVVDYSYTTLLPFQRVLAYPSFNQNLTPALTVNQLY